MSKLKDLTLSMLDAKNTEINDIVGMKTTAMEKFVREKVVIPYCKKHGYRFISGMGSWCFVDPDGAPFHPGEDRHKVQGRPTDGSPEADEDRWYVDPTEEDHEIRDILSYTFETQRCCIGAYMESYTP